ncbi:DUF1566 domain-containing protein [Trinickia sp. LjRoot230]|uniref:hypothetical protein n=1 Tax=Trinickia sp. LjRoot230 TaxID=3342288 RepID=UPI003ECFBD3B
MMISNPSAGNLTAPNIGEYWVGQGGIYAGVMPDYSGHEPKHLIFSVDEATRVKWGGYLVPEPNARDRDDGAANTNALVASSTAHPAARWADNYEKDGRTDFHLPSRTEWDVAAVTIPDAFVRTDWYWSSTEYSETAAYGHNFNGHPLGHMYKTFPGRARAVRTIPA